MPSNNDGRVIINIDSNASKVARDFQNLTNDTSKYERILRNVAGTSNATLPIYDKIRAKLKEQQAAANSAIVSYQKLANAQKSGIGFSQLNSVTGSAIERLRNLALQGRQNSTEFQNLASVVRSANSQMQNANNVVNAAISGSKGLSGALGSLGGSLGSLASSAAAGFALLKLKDYGQYALQTSAAFEQLAISFRVMTGSAQTGQELTDAIIKLGAETPMTAQQLSKAAQLLLSFGESAENIIPDLQLLGDITGGEVNRFNMLALAFAQVGANGKLMGQDLLQMVNAGFNPLQTMSQTTGKSMGELRKEMEMGRISFQMVAQAMKDAASEGGRYFGLMEQQSQSLNGRLSTLGDTWEQVSKNIGDAFVPMAKAAVNALIRLGEQVLALQQKMQAFQKSFNGLTVESQQQRASGFQQQANELYKLAEEYQRRGNASWASEYRKQADEFAAAAERARQKAEQLKNTLQSSALNQSGANTGFNATVLTTPRNGGGSVAKQKDAFDRLQEAAKNARREVELNAIAYGTSSPQVQQAFEKYRNLNTQLNDINKIFDKNTQIVGENGNAYSQLQQKINDTRNQLLNMAVSGQGDTAQFTMLKNTLKQYELQAQQANTAVTNSVGLSWKNISNTISSQLSYALTTPLQEGENAFERLGNVALNVIGQIAQAWLSNSLNNLFSGSGGGGKSSGSGLLGAIGGLAGSFFGPAGSAAGGFLGGALDKLFADGASFRHGRVVPFAQGGVVQSASTFPMAGNRTGLMGERGAEAIMPLKRTPSGQLGVQAQVQQPSINIYNQSGANIETVQRPDGDTDIFIKRVNSALRSERTQNGFSSALQRNNSRGVQAS